MVEKPTRSGKEIFAAFGTLRRQYRASRQIHPARFQLLPALLLEQF
jgi:hypothetical protein